MRSLFATALSLMLTALALGIHGADGAECPDPPSRDGVTAICGIAAPEDLALFEDRYLVVSSLAPAAHLFFVDVRDDSAGALKTSLTAPSDGPRWGRESCEPPRLITSHGLDLSRDPDGRWRLLVVSHGERETVEFFEVLPVRDAPPILQWRGCVETPSKAQFNDIVALPDGGYLATDPVGSRWQRSRTLLGMSGVKVGRVYRWRPDEGHETVPNSATRYPNGIALAPSGDAFYVNAYLANEVRRHDLATGEITGRVCVKKPDNSNWSLDGKLWVASHEASVLELAAALGDAPATRNTLSFAIVEIDPKDMSARQLFADDGSALGGGTAAVEAGGAMYIGAFRGDRLLRVELAGD